MRPPLPDDPAGVLHGEPEHDEGERRLGHAVVLAQVVLHSLRQQRRVRDLVVYFYIHLNIFIFFKCLKHYCWHVSVITSGYM